MRCAMPSMLPDYLRNTPPLFAGLIEIYIFVPIGERAEIARERAHVARCLRITDGRCLPFACGTLTSGILIKLN